MMKITLMPHCQATCTKTATSQICHVSRGDSVGVHINLCDGMVSYRWLLPSAPVTHSGLRGGGGLHQRQPCARESCDSVL